MKIKGKVWKFGDHINTDDIIAARYLNTTDEKELASHCMETIRPVFSKSVKEGDINRVEMGRLSDGSIGLILRDNEGNSLINLS